MLKSLKLVGIAAMFVLAAAPARGQTAAGATLFANHCAVCHEGAGADRAPSRDALRARTPEAILAALTSGIMTSQAAALTDGERRTLAEYLSGRALGTAQVLGGPAGLQAGAGRSGGATGEQLAQGYLTPIPFVAIPQIDRATSRDWPLHNLDLANSRYSPLGQINSSNVKSLAVKWLYHMRDGGATPIVVDGMMYVTTSESVVALDAATGRAVWSTNEARSNRGAAYGDGKIYVAREARLWALDAKTGKLVESFGDKGVSHVLTKVLTAKFPQLKNPAEWGYFYNMAPQYHAGIVVVGTALTENHIPSGVVLAVDGRTGKLLWKFWGVPQGPDDEGWDIAKDTWVGGVRHGGGIWATPAIDSESGTLHVTIANPSPDQDGSARKGINLFTNAFVALDLKTGKLKRYYQQVHHDLWDYDAGQQPTLFDIRVSGRIVKAVAAGNKNGYVYILNRETGQPINPIVETPVPTKTEVPGEEVWPTQPIPHTASGEPMVPAASQVVPENLYSQYASYPKVPFYTPPTLKGAIHAPREGVHYGGNSFNPQSGLLYVAGKDLPLLLTATPVGTTLKPGQQLSTAGKRENAAPETGNVSAYDPATGELVWRTPIDGGPSAGTVATAGNLVIAGDRQGTLYALNATNGKMRWRFYTGASIRSAQITYQVNGTQYLTVASGRNLIITFALPDR
jgi:PQQ-dependent dehydrogenase (methanol/ethanol family)